MSDTILKALIQLFALIIDINDEEEISSESRGIVRLFLLRQLNKELLKKYMDLFEEYLVLYNSDNLIRGSIKERKRTSLKAMRILAICEKINEELHQKQKVYVIVQVIDFILYNAKITENELDFLDTVSAAFNIPLKDYKNIKSFILRSHKDIPEKSRVLIIDDNDEISQKGVKHLYCENLKGVISFLHISVTNTYVFRYSGREDLFLNGQNIFPSQTYIFDYGSTIRGSGINTIFYYDVSNVFTEEAIKQKISFDAANISYSFKNSDNGIKKLSFHEESGTLVGILGGSGAGKSTLLNVLSGLTEPQSGEVIINGYNLYSNKDKIKLKGVIGFVPQDDLLIEELTVYQNLYFSTRLCLDDLQDDELAEAVESTLIELDLYEIRNLKVGNSLNKVISGGQRKRLNIALELIRKPTVLFVDEPTSGLSSVDSEIVLNLLKEQTYKGKLVIVSIHQPGSDIYKMFDKVLVIDKGGYQVFYSNPTEAIQYFKTQSSHVNADEDCCTACGNVNPDQILQIIEAKVVNEYGKPTQIRKVSPEEWAERFKEKNFENNQKTQNKSIDLPENYYSIPGLLKQSKIFFVRDVLSKLSNKQYVLICLIGAPLLAFLLAGFTKYSSGQYGFSDNENLPAYLFMSVITSLFLGLIISAEEIIRDKRILKRESFLNLSWFSYLNSKITIMFLISAIQTISFILIGNSIFEINGMTLSFWIILFSTSCFANLLGLNISSAFNSAITIYILIPFILIPQLLFSGVLVKFDRLNKRNSSVYEYVPLIGDVMAARWSFEAMAVEQFKNNRYERNYFKYNMGISQNHWYATYLVPELKKYLWQCEVYNDSILFRDIIRDNYKYLNHHIEELNSLAGFGSLREKWKTSLNEDSFSPEVADQTGKYLDSLAGHFRNISNSNTNLVDSVSSAIQSRFGKEELIKLKTSNYNSSLKDLVTGRVEGDKTLRAKNKIVQNYQPIYMKPVSKFGRAQFYSPYKMIGNIQIDTFWFNVLVLWLATFMLYIALYYNILQKTVNLFLKAYSFILGRYYTLAPITRISSL